MAANDYGNDVQFINFLSTTTAHCAINQTRGAKRLSALKLLITHFPSGKAGRENAANESYSLHILNH